MSDDWKFDICPDYDVIIKRKGEGLETDYFVQPTSTRSELTEQEQKMVDEKVKDLKEVISRMKEKAMGQLNTVNPDDDVLLPKDSDDVDSIDVENIPF